MFAIICFVFPVSQLMISKLVISLGSIIRTDTGCSDRLRKNHRLHVRKDNSYPHRRRGPTRVRWGRGSRESPRMLFRKYNDNNISRVDSLSNLHLTENLKRRGLNSDGEGSAESPSRSESKTTSCAYLARFYSSSSIYNLSPSHATYCVTRSSEGSPGGLFF